MRVSHAGNWLIAIAMSGCGVVRNADTVAVEGKLKISLAPAVDWLPSIEISARAYMERGQPNEATPTAIPVPDRGYL